MSLDLRLRAHLWGFGVGDESMKLGLELVAAMTNLKLHYSPMTKPNTQPQHSHGATHHDSGCSVRAFLKRCPFITQSGEERFWMT